MAQKRKSDAKRVQSTPSDPVALHLHTIADALANKYGEVTTGKMMSSPGLRFREKFFAFYYKQQIVCRFGRDFQPDTIGITTYTLLSPFNTKPPLRDWYCIPVDYYARWQELAHVALQRMAGDELQPVDVEDMASAEKSS